MARPEVQQSIDTWFDSRTREGEHAWVEQLESITPIYTEMGYTKGEGALIFSIGHLLMQVTKMHSLLVEAVTLLQDTQDEDDEEDDG